MKSAEKIETFLREAFPGQTIAVGDLSPTLRMRLRHVAVLIGRLEERGLTLMPFPSDKGRWVTGRVLPII